MNRFLFPLVGFLGLCCHATGQTPPPIPVYHLNFARQELTSWGQAAGAAAPGQLNASAVVQVVEDAALPGNCATFPMNAGGSQGPYLALTGSTGTLHLTGANDALTVSAWIKWNGPNGHSNPKQYVAGCLPASLNQGWGFSVCKNGTLCFDWFRANGTAGSRNSTATVPQGQWTHVAVTWQNNNNYGLSFYINGAAAGINQGYVGSGGLTATSQPVILGTGSTNFYLPLNGALADVQLFDQALAQADVSRICLFKATGERFVFAHYMVCFAPGGQATVDHYKQEIQQAQARGIDGFALNCGGWTVKYPAYRIEALLFYQAAEELGTNFKLFVSADLSGGLTQGEITDMVESFRNHPNQLHYQGKPVFSVWGGSAATTSFVRAQFAGTAPAAVGGPVFYVPFCYPSPATEGPTPAQVQQVYNDNAAADGFFYFGAAGSPGAIAGYIQEMAQVWHAGGKLFMAPVTPYYRGLGGNYRLFETSGFQGMSSEWLAATQYADWVEMPTWNDFGESSYVSPFGTADQVSLPNNAYSAEGNVLNHSAYLDAGVYYLNWFKLGHPLEIEQDQVYYFYRLTPKSVDGFKTPPYAVGATATDSPPANAGGLNDQVYATVFLTAPAQLTITIGTSVTPFSLNAGVTNVSVPLVSGTPQFLLQRNGGTLFNKTGEQSISPNNTWSNFQYFSSSTNPLFYADPPSY